MVRGLDIFRDFFADYRDCYVLIGGSACDVYFTDQEIPFRVTHDLDMILCVEALTPPFFNRFWEFIRAGGYVHRRTATGSSTGSPRQWNQAIRQCWNCSHGRQTSCRSPPKDI